MDLAPDDRGPGPLAAPASRARGPVARGLALCLAFAGVTAAAPARAETADEIATRLGREIEDDTAPSDREVDFGRSRLVVDRPVEDVLRVVTDYGQYETFMPRFQESRVLSRRGDRAMIYIEATIMRGAHTLWAQMRIAPGRSEGDTRVIEGRMVRGNMEAFTARWRLTPVRDGTATLVEFDMLVDLDLPFPSSVLTGENVKSAHKAVWALRRRVLGRQ